MTGAILEKALEYRALGWSVFPVGKDKKPLIKWSKYQDELATEEQIRTWATQWPHMNLGVATGALSGLVVLDLDIKHGWNSKRLRELGYGLPPTATARTGNGGEHFFFKHPGDDIPNSGGQLFGEGVDIRGKGGFIVLAPSVTAYKDKDGKDSGGAYEWIVPPQDGIADMPDWLLEKIQGGEKTKEDWRALLHEDCPEGRRNGVAASIAGGLLRTIKDIKKWEPVAWPRLQKWNEAHCKPPLREKEIRDVYESIATTEEERRVDLAEDEDKKGQKVLLMELATSNPSVELFRDEYGNGCARVVIDDHKAVMACGGKRFKQWLSHSYLERYGDIAESKNLSSAIHTIESKAIFKGEEHKLHNRVARDGDTIWYDLADDKNRAVRITPEGWGIVEEPPTIFRRSSHQSAQVDPEHGGDIRDLFQFVNVTDPAHQLLLLVYLVACFIPNFPHVLLYIHGQQGSAKSTLSRILRRLVDPSRLELVHMPKSDREIKLQLFRHHLIFYENVDGISDAISTVLCIGVTGGSSGERELYTNGEDFIFNFQLNIGINGINISAIKADLLERSLLFELKPVEEGKRRDEREIYAGFEKERPKIFGAILDVVAKAMAIHPSITIKDLPRMADFALWGAAIAEALGHTKEEFLEAYDSKIREQSEEALVQSVEAAALLTFMQDRTEWTGTARELLSELSFLDVDGWSSDQSNKRERMSAQQLPKQPQVLTRRLNELKPNLRKLGIEIAYRKENGIRTITIRKLDKNSVQSVNTDPEIAVDDKDDVDDIKNDEIPF